MDKFIKNLIVIDVIMFLVFLLCVYLTNLYTNQEEEIIIANEKEASPELVTYYHDLHEAREVAIQEEMERREREEQMNTKDTITKSKGVYIANDGVRETWYSSRVERHYRTNEWLVDSEGFYRDSITNRYVVAMQLPLGTYVEGSKGPCIVLDWCNTYNTRDYYVNW